MNQFFVEPSAIKDGYITIEGNDVKHIQGVLRLRCGEEIQAVANGLTYFCSIDEMDKDRVICKIEDVQSESNELPVQITIYQGLPKGDKLEFVIQKAVELGACRIVPVSMKRSVVKIDPKRIESKRNRWQSIAESAAAQSKRSLIPEVSAVLSYKEALKEAQETDVILLPYELAEGMDETREILKSVKDSDVKTISVFIGPEGGFENSEIDDAISAGAKIITLGKRILRTETAPLAILSWLIYLFD